MLNKIKSNFSLNIKETNTKLKDLVTNSYELYKTKTEISDQNWYLKTAQSCENVADSILRENKGTSAKVTKSVVGKIGVAGTSVGVFSLASIVGTASTGTAIGSLSGAAFTSASLAWLGGSVFMGSVILGIASIAGGIGAVLGAGWVFKKYIYGQKREKSELEIKEQNLIDACMTMAAAFRQHEQQKIKLDPIVAQALYQDALEPLILDLYEYKTKVSSWKYLARKRLVKAIDTLIEFSMFAKSFASKYPNLSLGIVSAVMIQLMSDSIDSFDENEELVLEALRRSNNNLKDATNEDLSEYVQSLDINQLDGLKNNIKGIYHELKFSNRENSDGDEYIAELFTQTNHAGADVILTNTITGEIKEIQLKATDYLSYVQKHNEKYQNIDLFATSEVAEGNSYINDSGFTNEGLMNDVNETINILNDNASTTGNIASSMAVSSMIILAKNINILLKKETLSQNEKDSMMKDALVATGTSGLVTLMI